MGRKMGRRCNCHLEKINKKISLLISEISFYILVNKYTSPTNKSTPNNEDRNEVNSFALIA